MKKTLGCLLLIMLLVVAGCSFGGNHKLSSKKSEESKQETVKKESEEEKDPEVAHYKKNKEKISKVKAVPVLEKIEPFITEKTFMNSTGMQGWKDYKSLMNQVKLADYNFTKESKGASMEDVDKFFKNKKGVKRKEVTTYDGLKQVNYWYVDKSGKKIGGSDTPVFYAEILTKYKDGKLIYASVEPGSYSYSNKNAVNLDKVEELDDLSMFSNLKDPKPVPYSVAQMEISSVPVTSVSFVTKGGNHKDNNPEKEQVDMPQLAYLTVSPQLYHDKEHPDPHIIGLVALPYLNASRDFGNAHYSVLNNLSKEMKEKLASRSLDLDK
ncbi:TPA: hypothetical protein I2017_RS06460 [Staphylococcus aureus]|nr:hypothetical protein [Staphylococcus aureus]